MTGILINRSQLARTMDKPLPTVDAWVARGCAYERCGRGLQFDSVKVVAWLMEREASAGARSGATLYLGEQRARLAREQAEHAAIKNQRIRAELLPAEDALASWDRATAHARAVLLALPATLTCRVCGHRCMRAKVASQW